MTEPDECQLEQVLARQRIGAGIFLPFVIARLQSGVLMNEATLAVSLRDVPEALNTNRRLKLRWNAANVPAQPLAVQEKVVTEWAACGVACAVVAVYTGLHVLSVAEEGDRFDYWVSNGQEAFGLEVSGTLSDEKVDLEARHRAKIAQLRENPYKVDGYVVIVGLTTREIILSRQWLEEAVP